MEKETRLIAYRVEYICDKCGKGFMEPTGIIKTSNPPLWEHDCSNLCGNFQDFREQYPYIKYEEQENE